MSLDNLPVEWSVSQLTKMIASEGLISDGDWIESKDQDEKGDIRLIQLADIGDGDFRDKSNRYMNQDAFDRLNCVELKANDVLIARMPDPLGRACIFPKLTYKCVTVVDVCLIRTGEHSAISPKLLKYWINSTQIRNLIALNATGTTRKRITRKKLESFDFPVPPLAEQQEIVRQLDVMLAQVEHIKARLDAIPAILKKFRQSVLADAVSGKLTEEWRSQNTIEAVTYADIKNAHLETFINVERKNSNKKGLVISDQKILSKYKPAETLIQDEFDLTLINQIPKNWTSTNLDNIAIIVTGKTPSTTDEDNWHGEIPFISPSQILETGDLIKPERYVSNLGIQKVPFIPRGSILIVCIGTIGKVGLLKEDVAFNQQLNALIPTFIIRKEFLFMWCKTLHAWLNKTSSAVVNAAIINKSRLSMAPCPVPALEEQDEIIKISNNLLVTADTIESLVNSAQKRVNLLTQSILAKAFSGELTAEWREQHQELITGINSAEVLLAKIQAERKVSKPVKKTRKKKEV